MPTPPARTDASWRSRVGSLRWWFEDRHGRVTLAQWPNPALAVWLVAVVLTSTGALGTARSETLDTVGQGALLVWALDELARGASPARRVLGTVVLTLQLVRLFG